MRDRRLQAAVLLALLAAGWLWMRSRDNAWRIVNREPRGTNLIAFGDSLTEGYRMSEGQSYPDQLARLLGRPVLNRGNSGDTTADALARIEQDVLAHDPRIVLLCLGANDMLRRQDPEQQFANLRQMILRIQDRGALVVLIGVEGYPLLARVDYGARYRELAKQTGAVYMPDVMDGILGRAKLMHDEIHPNADGYARIARRLVDEVGGFLK